jgi:hypothetical protein
MIDIWVPIDLSDAAIWAKSGSRVSAMATGVAGAAGDVVGRVLWLMGRYEDSSWGSYRV